MTSINDETKKKLVSTVAFYENKCKNLEGQMDALKKGLLQLWTYFASSANIPSDLDKANETASALELLDAISKNLKQPSSSTDNTSTSAKFYSISQLLTKLLNELPLTAELEAPADKIRDNFCSDNISEELLRHNISQFSQLVLSLIKSDKERVATFIKKYSAHFEDVNAFVHLSQDNGAENLKSIIELENGIKNNVDEMKGHLDKSSSTGELVELLGNNMSAINNSVVEYKKETENTLSETEKHISSLKEQLTNMEKLNKQLEQSLSSQFHIARHDALTGLPNRIYYNEYAKQAYARAKRSCKPLSLSVVDIDFFKKVNDTYGHLAGDDILKITANLLQKSIREVDFCARYGGEEFVIIFESCNIGVF